jgi:DNA-binding transcriptional ArsR family regulator
MTNLMTLRSALEKAATGKLVDTAAEKAACRLLLKQLQAVKLSEGISELVFTIKKVAPDREKAVSSHLQALRSAGLKKDAFDGAVQRAMSDRNLRAEELRALAAEYTGRKIPAKTSRPNIEKLLRQTFSRQSWQSQAYERIEKLTAAE